MNKVKPYKMTVLKGLTKTNESGKTTIIDRGGRTLCSLADLRGVLCEDGAELEITVRTENPPEKMLFPLDDTGAHAIRCNIELAVSQK